MKIDRATSMKSINILVGYGWDEHDDEHTGLNAHWDFLRDSIKKAASEVKKRAANRQKSFVPLKISISRLRASHGEVLLGDIFHRIENADILVYDISGNNANVLIELGYSIAKRGAVSNRIYIFSKADKVPSELRGYMLTKYTAISKNEKGYPSYALKDMRGFQASMRGTLIKLATERGMWGSINPAIKSSDCFQG